MIKLKKLSKASKMEIQGVIKEHKIKNLEELQKIVSNFVAIPADHEFQFLIDLAILYTLPNLFKEVYTKIPKRSSNRYFSKSTGITYMGYGKDWNRVFLSTEEQKNKFKNYLIEIYKKDKNEQLAKLILQVMGYEKFNYEGISSIEFLKNILFK